MTTLVSVSLATLYRVQLNISDKMSGKKLINRPEDAVDEALEGKHITFTMCHCQQMDCLARFDICVGFDWVCEDYLQNYSHMDQKTNRLQS